MPRLTARNLQNTLIASPPTPSIPNRLPLNTHISTHVKRRIREEVKRVEGNEQSAFTVPLVPKPRPSVVSNATTQKIRILSSPSSALIPLSTFLRLYVEQEVSFDAYPQKHQAYLDKLYIMEPLFVKTIPENETQHQKHNVPIIKIRSIGNQYNTQRDLVNACISQLAEGINAKITDQNVLLMGFQKDAPHTRGVHMAGVYGLQWVMPNSAFEEIKKQPWEQLLKITGDALMCHLLKNEQIFLKLNNGCLWQLTGVPINKTVRERKKELYYSKTNSSNSKYMYTVRMENRAKWQKIDPVQGALDAQVQQIILTQTTVDEEAPSPASDVQLFTSPDMIASSVGAVTASHVDIKPIQHTETTPTRQHQQSSEAVDCILISPPPTESGTTSHEPTPNPKKRKRNTLPDHHPSKVFLSRRLIMFSPPAFLSDGLPVTHILNKLTSDSKSQAKVLYQHIFGKKLPPTELNHILTLLAEMKRNHLKKGKRLRFLIEKYCPVELEVTETNDTDVPVAEVPPIAEHAVDGEDPHTHPLQHNDEEAEVPALHPVEPKATLYSTLIGQHSTYSQVSTFIHHFLNKLIPVEFFGSESNRRTLYGHISRFVSLSLYDSFTLQEAMDSIKITDCAWAFHHASPQRQKAAQFAAATHRVSQFIQFIFTQLVVPLLRSYFYCTETNEHRAHVYYYRRDVWRKISSLSWEKLASDADLYEKIPEGDVNDILAKNSFASAGLSRLLPKRKKIRAIVNLSRKYQNRTGRLVDTNTLLKHILHAMKYEFRREPNLLGSSVFSAIDIYNRLLPFVKLWKRTTIGNVSRPKLYWVSVDVTGSYDNIPQEKLFDVTKRIFSADSYLLVRYYMLRPSMGSLSAKYACTACLPADFPSSFPSFFNEFLVDKYKKTLFVDQVLKRFVSREELLHMLRDHIYNNLVRMGSEHFRQSKGIPQGSVLSPLLCSHMYAHLEKCCLAHLPGACAVQQRSQHHSQHDSSTTSFPSTEWNYFPPTQDTISMTLSLTSNDSHIGVLTRLIDDFLYVTTDRDAANSFLESMRSGFSEYGIKINEEKTKLNFEPRSLPKYEDTTSLEWCGFLINTKNFEITKSYRKYVDNHIGMFTSKRMYKPGFHFARKLKAKVSYLLSPLLIDCTINSLLTAYINVYQCAMFVAMHFHIFRRLMDDCTDEFLLKTMEDLVGYFWIIIRTRAAVINRSNSTCVLLEGVTICIVLHAFQRVLGRKQSVYQGEHGLLSSIAKTLARETKNVPVSQREVYLEVLRDERCEEMMKIRY